MGALLAILSPLSFLNEQLLRVGRGIGVVAIALMVLAILIQVVFRYGFNNALPWPDEAARFCMLWMTGLMAPTAFRRGGFVAIDMFGRALPTRVGQVLTIFLLLVSLVGSFLSSSSFCSSVCRCFSVFWLHRVSCCG